MPDLAPAQVPHVGLYRRATGTALVLGPALFLVDNLIHPKEYTRGNEAEQAAEIAETYTRWQLAHAIGFVSIVVFVAVVLGLAFLVRRRQPGLGLLGGAFGAVGLLGLAAAITIDGFAWGIAGEVSAKGGALNQGAVAVLHDLQHSEWSLLFYGTILGFVVGVVVLSLGAARQGAIPWWAGGLLALAAVMVGAEGAVISNAYFIASAAVLLAGGAAVAAAVLRMTDEEFAAGGP